MLRINDLRLPRVDAEERRVEHLHVFQNGLRSNVLRVSEDGFGNAFRRQLLVREEADGLDPVTQVLPELLDVSGPGEAGRDTDHSNLAEVFKRIRTRHPTLLAFHSVACAPA